VQILPRFRSPLVLAVLATAFAAACGSAAAAPSAAGTGSVRPGLTAAIGTAGAARTAAAVRSQAAKVAGTTVPGAPNCPMFPANNIWNTDISELPVAVHSTAWLRSTDAGSTYLHPDFGPDTGGYPYGIPYAVVTSAHPTVSMRFQYASESYRGQYPFGATTPIEGGQNAGGDRHALMVNKSTCTLYELWEARYSSRPTAGSGAMWNLRSNALRPAGWTSADAAGLPILPGLLNYSQVQQAVKTGTPIRHAIRMTAETTRDVYIWPARHEAGSSNRIDLPPMGARFRLRLSFNVAGYCKNSAPYCADAKAVLVEMQHYGLILADNGSNWYFGGTAYPQWPSALVQLLKGIPARDFVAVNTSCLMVSPNSGEAQAKPGCPIG
jgi:hypothetical protein